MLKKVGDGMLQRASSKKENKRRRNIGLVVVVSLLASFIWSGVTQTTAKPTLPAELKNRIKQISVEGVCPPFYLCDEHGKVIDPVHGINLDKPYSPKQTCGKCHDYNKITEGFHFQQGRGEKPTALMVERCLWVTSPGNYGGNW